MGLVLAAVSAGAAITGCGPRDAGVRTERLSVATGGTGGVYYPYGGGVAQVVSDRLEGVEATAEVTAGSVDNLKFISNRDADVAFVLADSLDDAVRGRGAFAGFGAVRARTVAVLYDNLSQAGIHEVPHGGSPRRGGLDVRGTSPSSAPSPIAGDGGGR